MPTEGDIIGIDTDSAVGHEQQRCRPVLVVSVNALQTSRSAGVLRRAEALLFPAPGCLANGTDTSPPF